MKKSVAILLGVFCFSLSVFADEIDDYSIIDALEKKSSHNKIEKNFDLNTFQSCEDMKDVMESYIKKYWKQNKEKYFYPLRMGGDIMLLDGSPAMETMAIPVGSSMKGAGLEIESDFSKTNSQVQGVDESDIIKTDGKYIYYFNQKDNYVYVIDSKDLKTVKKIKVPKQFFNPVLYIDKNRLTIISSGNLSYNNQRYIPWIDRQSKTYVIIFDTKDIKQPKLVKLYAVDGALQKTRKIGNYLYVISNNRFDIPYYNFKEEGDIEISISDIIPRAIEVTQTTNSKKQNLKVGNTPLPYNLKSGDTANCKDISYALPDNATMEDYEFSPSYNIISVLNMNEYESDVETSVIAGDNSEIYMSLDNLYITTHMYEASDFDCPENMYCIMRFYPRGVNTLIHKLNIKGSQLQYSASAVVPGSPLTQYSMDEYKGDFRILTQKYRWNSIDDESYTSLFILDKDLKLRSSLDKLGKGEEFKSSRYIGDKLYLVTFEQVDPLFVIDVANPDSPKVLGELKIPGYSTYLHPYDENHLIGLGYDTAQNKFGGVYNDGVKVDLYQINYDKKCGDLHLSAEEQVKCASGDYKGIIVKQLYTKTLGEYRSTSEALNNPRVFVWNQSKNILLLPASLYYNDIENRYQTKDFQQGIYGISINKDAGIEYKYHISHLPEEEGLVNNVWKYRNDFIQRSLWIGEKVYAISKNIISLSDLETGMQEKQEKLK